MIRRPPRSTLFPYTDALPIYTQNETSPPSSERSTCRRRASAAESRWQYDSWLSTSVSGRCSAASRRIDAHSARRSEEHTSELQSLAYLVCRLLLEKKKIRVQP